jgi:tetratricopeptide (TPR) repeat protein
MFRLPICPLGLVLAAGLSLVASVTLGQGTDQVFPVKGAPIKGSVSDMTKDTVSLDMSGVSRPFQVNEIVRITFVDEPSELSNARNAVTQRNYSLALQELKKLDGQPQDRPVIAADIGYYRALCLARLAMTEGGDKAAALKALLDWVKANPNNYHFYQAAEALGDLAVASGDYGEAARFYGGLSNAPWGDYQMRGNNAVGRALVAEKKFPDALQKFDAVIASELTTPEASEQKLLATVGKAVCLAETGQADQGVAMLNDIIKDNDPSDVALFARTYNALGNCYLKMSRPKDAIQAFLHTDILFYADGESHAEALYRLSKLWNDVNRSDRAVQARNTLRERYAGSVWASME